MKGKCIKMHDIDKQDLSKSIAILTKYLQELAKVIQANFSNLIQFHECVSKLQERIHSKEYKNLKKQITKIDFTRPVVKHQVSNRKPRHLIKKIIH